MVSKVRPKRKRLPNFYIDRNTEYLYQTVSPLSDEAIDKIKHLMDNELKPYWPSDVMAISIEALYSLIKEGWD